MHPPLISIVIPTYNRADTITRAIESVTAQDYPNLEIVLVDDGSSDNTESVIANLDAPGLRIIRHAENRGANAARNTGVREARGEFVAFQDSDDFWEPRKLSVQVAALQSHEADICFCAFERRSDGLVTRIPKPGYGIQPGCRNRFSELMRGSFISCQTLVVKRELLLAAGLFDEALPRLQDWELCLRLAKDHPIVYVDQALVRVDISEDSMSRQTDKYARAAELIFDKHRDDFRNHPEAAAMLCTNVALDALRHRRPGGFVRFMARAAALGRLQFPAALLSLYRRR
jgi:glycosyltransferase involved in cell wall biosynthesis